MNKLIFILLAGTILASGITTVAADPDYGVTIDMLTYVTPTDIKNNTYDVNVKIIAEDIPVWAYPLTIKYFYDGKETLNSTLEYHGYNSFSKNAWFSLDGKPDGTNMNTEVQIISAAGTLVGLGDRYEPVYVFSPDQENFSVQVIAVNISQKENDGILGFMKEDFYETKFTVKNMDENYAFKGILEFGDLGVASAWKTKDNILLGPLETFEIKGPILNEKSLQNIRTEIECKSFLNR